MKLKETLVMGEWEEVAVETNSHSTTSKEVLY